MPSSVDLLLVLISSQKPDSTWLFATLAVAGSLAGNLILFFIARKGGQLYLERHAAGPKGRRALRWFHHYGLITLFIPALVPVPLPMKVFVIAAGALGLSATSFLTVLLVARVIRYGALAYLGSQLGDHAMDYLKQHMWHLFAIALGIMLLSILLMKASDYRRARVTSTGGR